METWELNVLGIADWRDPRWKLAGLLAHLEAHPELPGAVVELGVYRGRCLVALALAMREDRYRHDPILKTSGPREVWGYDGFAGLPEPGPRDLTWAGLPLSPEHAGAVRRRQEIDPDFAERDFGDCSMIEAQRLATIVGVSDWVCLSGVWPPNCRQPPMGQIAAASLDCDLYDSYRTALPWVWERLVPGGYVHLDEYYSLKYPGPRRFVDEWLKAEGLEDCLRMHERIPREFERWYLVKPGS